MIKLSGTFRLFWEIMNAAGASQNKATTTKIYTAVEFWPKNVQPKSCEYVIIPCCTNVITNLLFLD
jgi:hypothetical protein